MCPVTSLSFTFVILHAEEVTRNPQPGIRMPESKPVKLHIAEGAELPSPRRFRKGLTGTCAGW